MKKLKQIAQFPPINLGSEVEKKARSLINSKVYNDSCIYGLIKGCVMDSESHNKKFWSKEKYYKALGE